MNDKSKNPLGVFERLVQPHIIQRVHEHVTNDIDTEVESKPFNFRSKSQMNICLHPLSDLQDEFEQVFFHHVVDEEMLTELRERNVMNWCRTSNPLLPIKTTGDGNCLLHALSIFLWGVQDSDMLLRRLLCVVLGNDSAGTFKQRWRKEKGYVAENVPGLNLSSLSWDREWDTVVKQVDDTPHRGLNQLPYSCLEEIHVFIMANILKRPIIVLCDPMLRSPFGMSIQDNNFGGIYLPLLWNANDCFKYPIVLGYSNSHFCPLVSQNNPHEEFVRGIPAEDVVPLVLNDQRSLRLHFLLDHEENRALTLLNEYLFMTEVVHTTHDSVNRILAAKLNTQPLPDDMNIMRPFFQALERSFIEKCLPPTPVLSPPPSPLRHNIPVEQGNPIINPKSNPLQYSQRRECETPGCQMYGSCETNFLCSRCFADFSKKDAEQEMLQRKQKQMIGERKSESPLIPVEPLDEKKMLPSKNHSHSETPKEHLYGKSPLFKECIYCHSKASQALCEGCLFKLKSSHKPNLPHSEDELFGPGGLDKAAANPGKTMKEAAVQTSPCKTPGCTESGKTCQQNMCSKCYVSSGNFTSPNKQDVYIHDIFARKQDIEETEVKPFPTKLSPQSPNKLKESWSEAELKKILCSTPGCSGLRLKNPHGMCYNCSDSTMRKKTIKPLKSSEEAVTAWLNNQPLVPESLFGGFDSQLIESRAPTIVSQNGTSPRQTCATPWCSNRILPARELCDPCLNVLSSALPKEGACRTKGCKFHNAIEFDGYCSNCYNSLRRKQVAWETEWERKPRNHSLPAATFATNPLNQPQDRGYSAPLFSRGKPCLTPSCSRYGDATMDELCTRCYQQKSSSQSAYQMSCAVPPNTGLYQTPTFTKPIQQVVQIPTEVTRTGLVISGPSHFRPSGRNQLVTSDDNSFQRQMSQLEGRHKSDKCRNAIFTGCRNFGSAIRQGYCSDCYDSARGEDVVDGQVLM